MTASPLDTKLCKDHSQVGGFFDKLEQALDSKVSLTCHACNEAARQAYISMASDPEIPAIYHSMVNYARVASL